MSECPAKQSVLILDDEPDIVELVKEYMERRNYRVFAAADGIEGLEVYRKYHMGIMLVDIKMPRMNGIEFLKEVKKQGDHTEVIMITGHGELDDAIACLHSGAFRYIQKPLNLRELHSAVQEAEDKFRTTMERDMLMEKLKAYSGELEKQVALRTAELTRTNKELNRMSITDDLTGAYNRRHLLRRLDENISQALRYELPLSVLMVDIDEFKRINDTLGHEQGDKVLKALAGLLRGHLRKGETVARYGGEEFVVVMPHTTMEMAMHPAELLRGMVENYMFPGMPEGWNVTVSIGVAELEKGPDSPCEILKRADLAMYDAKRSGKNRVSRGRDAGKTTAGMRQKNEQKTLQSPAR